MKAVKLVVEAGEHERRDCPISVNLGEEAAHARLVDPRSPKKRIFSQPEGGTLHFVLPELKARKVKKLELRLDQDCGCRGKGVEVRELDGKLEIRMMGKPFTVYHFGADVVRPFFHPVLGPRGVEMTRSWPVVEGVKGEDTDHVHHKSFWVAHGLVNGSDHWSEGESRGRQVHERFERLEGGCVYGGFVERLRWETNDGTKLLEETRTVRVWNTPEALRLIDLAVEFKATEGDVLFGDTKEGGLCSLRVAEAMKGARGGRIENAYGAVGEKECWGKRSPWVDYSGRLKGKHVGIAVLDHPLNPRHPTFWHVRDYGLFSANAFGLSYFKSSYKQQGDWTLPAGESAAFRYRVAFHQGDARKGRIADRFNDWVNPPAARKEE